MAKFPGKVPPGQPIPLATQQRKRSSGGLVLLGLAAVFLLIVGVGLGAGGVALWYFKPWADKPKVNGEVASANSDAEKPEPEKKLKTARHSFWDASVGGSEIDNILREMSAHQTGYLFVNSAGKFAYLPRDDPKGGLSATDNNALVLWSANQLYLDVKRLGPKTVVIRRFPLSRAECVRVLNDSISGVTLGQAQKQNNDNLDAIFSKDGMKLPELPEEAERIEKFKRLREEQERAEKERLAKAKREQEESERLAREAREEEKRKRAADIKHLWGAMTEWRAEVRRTGKNPTVGSDFEKKWREKWGPIPGTAQLYPPQAIKELQEEDQRTPPLASDEFIKKWRQKWD